MHSRTARPQWVFGMIASSSSRVEALVAHIPVPDGAAAVNAWLGQLLEAQCGAGAKPDALIAAGLRGGRVVLLGDPMPAPDACLAPAYLDGLRALARYGGGGGRLGGLHWEWCCKPEALPSIAKVCAQFPDMVFVLDHLGHNCGGDDLATWSKDLEALAASSSNVYAKLGAIEEWEVKDPAPYLDHALKVFGFGRVLYESNWFVSAAMGDPYGKTAGRVLAACKRAGATALQIHQVFVGNAKKVYRV